MIVSALMFMFLFCLAVGLLWGESLWENYKGAIITSWIFFVVGLVFAILLLVLVSLHVFLIANGLTTFQFIMNRRAEKQAEMDENRDALKVNNDHNKTQEMLHEG